MKSSLLHPVLGTVSSRCAKKTVIVQPVCVGWLWRSAP